VEPAASWDLFKGPLVWAGFCFEKVLQLHKMAMAAEIMIHRFIIFKSISSVGVIVGNTVIGITLLKLSGQGHLFFKSLVDDYTKISGFVKELSINWALSTVKPASC
jgi:hypothetical protein